MKAWREKLTANRQNKMMLAKKVKRIEARAAGEVPQEIGLELEVH